MLLPNQGPKLKRCFTRFTVKFMGLNYCITEINFTKWVTSFSDSVEIFLKITTYLLPGLPVIFETLFQVFSRFSRSLLSYFQGPKLSNSRFFKV